MNEVKIYKGEMEPFRKSAVLHTGDKKAKYFWAKEDGVYKMKEGGKVEKLVGEDLKRIKPTRVKWNGIKTPKDPTIRNKYRKKMRGMFSKKKLKALRKLSIERRFEKFKEGCLSKEKEKKLFKWW